MKVAKLPCRIDSCAWLMSIALRIWFRMAGTPASSSPTDGSPNEQQPEWCHKTELSKLTLHVAPAFVPLAATSLKLQSFPVHTLTMRLEPLETFSVSTVQWPPDLLAHHTAKRFVMSTFVLAGWRSGPMSTWRAGRLGFEGLAFAPDAVGETAHAELCARRRGLGCCLRPPGNVAGASHMAESGCGSAGWPGTDHGWRGGEVWPKGGARGSAASLASPTIALNREPSAA
jgi:hypothetical protein